MRRRSLEDYRIRFAPANKETPPKPEIRIHFLSPAKEAALRWRGFGSVTVVAALALVAAMLLT